jgi:RNA polymerase primary sigma factor
LYRIAALQIQYLSASIGHPIGMVDTLRDYMAEVARYPLLTKQQECELAAEISIWQQAIEANSCTPAMDRSGRKSLDKMVTSNLRLVIDIAKGYLGAGLPFQDLIQEGSLGLHRAALKFDHERGYKFSTYAYWWIKQAVMRACSQQTRNIRVPILITETLARAKRVNRELSIGLGRSPNRAEMAEGMEMSIDEYESLLANGAMTLSLDRRLTSESGDTLFEVVGGGESPIEALAANETKREVWDLLAHLNTRERDVIIYRFGMLDGEPRSLQQTGDLLGLSRERSRQIQKRAMQKMRIPAVALVERS